MVFIHRYKGYYLCNYDFGFALRQAYFPHGSRAAYLQKKHLPQKSFFLMKIDPSGRLFYFDYKNYAARFYFISR